jgi:radical SAM protein with 4Fe4S-binding SPASM domain
MLPYVRRISLLWDDPSASAELPSLLSALDEKKIPFTIRTAGRWSEGAEFLRALSGSRLFSMLIMSDYDERILDDTTDYSRTLSAHIRSARSLGIPLRTETPINERTEPSLEEILERSSLMGATESGIRRSPGAFGNDLSLFQEKCFRIFSRLETFMKEGWPLLFDECMPLCGSAVFSHFCGAGITSCHIDAQGCVYVCRYSDEALGSVISTALHSLYRSPRARRWRTRILDECGDCIYFALCKGGCRFLGKSMGISRDPLCSPGAIPPRKTYSQAIKISGNLAILPRFELRKGDGAWVITREHLFLVFPRNMEKLLRFLLTEPTLLEVERIFSTDSIGTIFELYERGFLVFQKRTVSSRRVSAEGNPEESETKRGIPPSPVDFNENLLLRLSSDLKLLHKGNKVLVVHPESASWRCVNAMDFYNVQYFRESTYVSEFLKEHVWMPEALLKPMVTNFYKAGIIEVNGLNFWNHPSQVGFTRAGPLQCILETCGTGEEIMEGATAKKVIETLHRHFRNDRKVIELRMQRSPEVIESWLAHFIQDFHQVMAGEAAGTHLRVVFPGPYVPPSVWGLLEKCHATLEIEMGDDAADLSRNAKRAFESQVLLIARMQAETPEKMRALFDRGRDAGLCAVRLAPLYDYDNPVSLREWGVLFVEILQEVSAGAAEEQNKPVLLIKELDCLIRNLLSRKRAHPCYRHPCGAGSMRLSFDWKGDLYPCIKMTGNVEFNCGPVGRDISPRDAIAKNDALKSCLGADDAIRCKECHWRNLCPTSCPAEIDTIFKGKRGPDPRCGLYQYLFEELCWRIDRNPAIIRMILDPSVF